MNLDERTLLENHLDAACISQWRRRLREARNADIVTYRAFDLEWAKVKAEYREKTGSVEPPEHPLVVKARATHTTARESGRMLTYNDVYPSEVNR